MRYSSDPSNVSSRLPWSGASVAVFSLAALFLLHNTPATSQSATPPASGTQSQSRQVSYQFGTAHWINLNRTIEADNGVTFTQGDETLKTDSAIAYLDADQSLTTAKSLAPVHIYDPQNDLTGLHGLVDFPHHTATLTDNVVLVVKPSNKDANAPAGSVRRQFKDMTTLTCESMVYDYRHKLGHIPGPLTIRQKDRTLTADTGEYDGNKQTVTLNGNVHGKDSQGAIVSTTKAIVYVKEGSESLTIPVKTIGVFPVKDDPDDSDNSSSSPAPPDTSSSGTPPPPDAKPSGGP